MSDEQDTPQEELPQPREPKFEGVTLGSMFGSVVGFLIGIAVVKGGFWAYDYFTKPTVLPFTMGECFEIKGRDLEYVQVIKHEKLKSGLEKIHYVFAFPEKSRDKDGRLIPQWYTSPLAYFWLDDFLEDIENGKANKIVCPW